MKTRWKVLIGLSVAFALLEGILAIGSYQEQGSAMPIATLLFSGVGIVGVIILLMITLIMCIKK